MLMPKKLYITLCGLAWTIVYIDGEPYDAIEEKPERRVPSVNTRWKYQDGYNKLGEDEQL